MSESYLAALSKFALRPTVVLADGAAVILAAVVPLGYTLLGKQMPDSAFQVIGTLVGVLIVAVVVMRAISAPYFVWKEDRATIQKLESEVAKPDMVIQQRLDQQIAESRIALSGYVVRLRGMLPQKREQLEEYARNFTSDKVQELVSHLAYDARFKELWEEFKTTLFDIVRYAPKDVPNADMYLTYQQTQEQERYRKAEAARYFAKAVTKADAIQEKLVNHLLMKG